MGDITWDEFKKIEIRVGTIVDVREFPEALKPAYKIEVDLGEDLGVKRSSAQITDIYSREDLIGRQVVVVANLSPKKIGSFTSEVLITGFFKENNNVVLAVPDKKVKNGSILS